MSQPRGVSEVARQLGVPPRTISDLFYERILSDEICPVIGGRRIIPVHYVPVIAGILAERRQANVHCAAGPAAESAGATPSRD